MHPERREIDQGHAGKKEKERSIANNFRHFTSLYSLYVELLACPPVLDEKLKLHLYYTFSRMEFC